LEVDEVLHFACVSKRARSHQDWIGQPEATNRDAQIDGGFIHAASLAQGEMNKATRSCQCNRRPLRAANERLLAEVLGRDKRNDAPEGESPAVSTMQRA